MWLKIHYKHKEVHEEFEYETFSPRAIEVSVIDSPVVPVQSNDHSIRLSKIFPLDEESKYTPVLHNCKIYFFDFAIPFRILGRLRQKASKQLQEKIFFSTGACSIILFSESDEIINEFEKLDLNDPNSKNKNNPTRNDLGLPDAQEKWLVQNYLVEKIESKQAIRKQFTLPEVLDYKHLDGIVRVIIDEFVVSLKILENKVADHNSYNSDVLQGLIKTVNEFIIELSFLQNPEGKIPSTMYITDAEILKSPVERQIIIHQTIDRLVQINSALSYVSTQMYSGSIPVLERRSLIRRSSLLGIGVPIRALNRIVDHIETAFSSIDFGKIIETKMNIAPPLAGSGDSDVKTVDWHGSNIQKLITDHSENSKIVDRKLSYFSSRYGFRESEFAITASLNSATNGLSLEWALMTITHEMLHSHVRTILTSIFYDKGPVEKYKTIYERYKIAVIEGLPNDYRLIDSIRELIFKYCRRTIDAGSLTKRSEINQANGLRDILPSFEDLHSLFQTEYRNINEIFVHVLDLNYFYKGKITKYVPLIWSSWSAVPHINADMRQYILRTLLSIASRIDQDPYTRWELAREQFISAIEDNQETLKGIPLTSRLLNMLNDHNQLMKDSFQAFKNSLIIVDLAMQIFYSESIASKIWNDANITNIDSDTNIEYEYSYNVPSDFTDIAIESPIPYLFDRMIRVLENQIDPSNIERQTAFSLLAINSR